MSALNDSTNLYIAQGQEFTQLALKRPPVALTTRAVFPSFAKSALTVAQAETIAITATVQASLSGGVSAYGSATGTQAFNTLGSIKLSPWDSGQIHFTNISVGQPASNQNIIVGHPQLTLVDGNGVTYPGGTLIAGRNHQGLQVQATVSVWTPDGSAPQTITINATGLLMGMARNH